MSTKLSHLFSGNLSAIVISAVIKLHFVFFQLRYVSVSISFIRHASLFRSYSGNPLAIFFAKQRKTESWHLINMITI